MTYQQDPNPRNPRRNNSDPVMWGIGIGIIVVLLIALAYNYNYNYSNTVNTNTTTNPSATTTTGFNTTRPISPTSPAPSSSGIR
jgi:hypothetical protein